MEKEEKVVTLGRIFKVAFGKLQLFVPVAVGVAVAAVLGIHFGLNTFRGSYVSTFSYSSADLSRGKYADGSDFVYQDIISYNNLNNVKNSDEKYASIDIDKIIDSSAISISSDSDEGKYTITLAYRFVKNQSLAKSFVNDVANYAINKDADIVNNGTFDSSLKLYESADSFEKKVNYLNSQATFLKDQYKSLANIATQDDTQTKDKKTSALPSTVVVKISSYSQELDLLVPNSFVSSMNTRIYDYGLNMDYSAEAVSKIVSRDEYLSKEASNNQSRIDALIDTIKAMGESGAVAELGKDIETLVNRNEDIKLERRKITNIQSHVGMNPEDVPGHMDFVKDMTACYNGLVDSITGYRNVLKAAYIDNADVNFDKTSVVELKGTINIYVNILLSLAVSVIVGAVVDLIVDRKKLYE